MRVSFRAALSSLAHARKNIASSTHLFHQLLSFAMLHGSAVIDLFLGALPVPCRAPSRSSAEFRHVAPMPRSGLEGGRRYCLGKRFSKIKSVA